MRCLWTFLWVLSLPASAQRLLINEVQTAPGSVLSGSHGEPVGWLELYNAGTVAVGLDGYRIALGGRQLHLHSAAMIEPGAHAVVRFDPREADEALTAPFALPKHGGTLLLIAPGGTRIVDAFTFGPLPPGTSMGRLPDGHAHWSRFEKPTPGCAAPGMEAVQAITQPPSVRALGPEHHFPMRVSITAPAGAAVHCSLDGSLPNLAVSPGNHTEIVLHAPAVVKATATRPDALPSPVVCVPFLALPQDTFPVVSLSLDPEDLWSDDSGIDTEGGHANHTRKGREWERTGHYQWLQGDSVGEPLGVGVRIAGSGSRSRPKRSFKVLVRDRFGSMADAMPGLGMRDEYFLRADATPHAFMRHLFMEEVVRLAGSRVDMQPSRAVELHLNGQYRGLYRIMPPKDAAWLQEISGAGAVDLLDGPAYRVLSGDDMTYMAGLEHLLAGAAPEALEQYWDLGSLTELACMDLYMGRVDHDINVRIWRPREAGGRWRWMLYDVDLWAPAREHSVAWMCDAVAPEVPYLPELLSNTSLRDALLARFSALMHTVLSPKRAQALLEAITEQHRSVLHRDAERWTAEMDMPGPDASLSLMRDHAIRRPGIVLEQLSEKTGLALRTLSIAVEPAGAGTVLIEGLAMEGDRSEGRHFAGVPLHLQALPAKGMRFVGWKGVEGDGADAWVDPARQRHVKALFQRVGSDAHGL